MAFRVPPALKVKNLINMLSKPRWAYSVLSGQRWTFGNLDGYVKGMDGVKSLAQWIGSQFDETLNWKDIEWIRGIWPGKLIIKGILDLEDAKLAAKSGAAALVVSNHGGRQLDGALSSISVLPKIAEAVGSEIELIFDGGVRTGQDVLRALALRARSCLIGRAYIFGLGAAARPECQRRSTFSARNSMSASPFRESSASRTSASTFYPSRICSPASVRNVSAKQGTSDCSARRTRL